MPSNIEWTDETWNPVSGCTKISAGCKHCYAERLWPRLSGPGQPYEGRAFSDVQCHEERLEQPLRWQRPRLIFVNSMSDLFHEDVPDDYILRVFEVMRQCSARDLGHVFQILTKRPERMRDFCLRLRYDGGGAGRIYLADDPDAGGFGLMGARGCTPLQNVWLGVSVENQAAAEERVPVLLKTPAALRFVSCEPLLGPVDLAPFLSGLRWVIAGGESGPQARPTHPEWIRALRDQCAAAGIPFFFKQWGAWAECKRFDAPAECVVLVDGRVLTPEEVLALPAAPPLEAKPTAMTRVGKRLAGALLDGQWEQDMPAC